MNDPEGEELLILLAYMIIDETNNLSFESVNSFLENNLLTRFLRSLYKKEDLKQFLYQWLSEPILKMEHMDNKFMDLDIVSIEEFLQQSGLIDNISNNAVSNNNMIKNIEISNKKNSSTRYFEKLSKRMSQFTKLKEEQENLSENKSKKSSFSINQLSAINEADEYEDLSNADRINSFTSDNLFNRSNSNDDLTTKYKSFIKSAEGKVFELGNKHIMSIINQIKDLSVKEFLYKKLNFSKSNTSLYSNYKITYNLNKTIFNKDRKNLIINQFNKSLDTIKNFIDDLLAALNSKIEFLPYSVRCICKIIYTLIKIKFDKLSEIEIYSFVGKFLFSNLLLPILVNPDYYTVLTNSVISHTTRKNLFVIFKILKTLSSYNLFTDNDPYLTALNPYIIELIPIITKLYSTIINIDFTNSLNTLFQSLTTEYKNHTTINNIVITKHIEYDYFNYLPGQLIKLNTILFSTADILLLMSLIQRNIYNFREKDIFKSLVKSYEKLPYQEGYLRSIYKNDIKSLNIRNFIIYQHEYNPKLKQILFPEKTIFTCTDFDELESEENRKFIHTRVKYCIKYILGRLNIMNKNTYSFLKNAEKTGDFFLGLNELVLLEDQNSQIDKIPLSWYSIYLNSNIFKIDSSYFKDNYTLLNEELFKEEQNEINNIQQKTNYIITKFGLNIRCAEKRLEIITQDRVNVKIIEKLIRIEKFIIQCNLPICVRYSPKIENDNRLTVCDPKVCIHTQIQNLDKMVDGSKSPFYEFLKFTNIIKTTDKSIREKLYTDINEHGKDIFDFVKLLSKINEVKSDILNGTSDVRIYDGIDTYLSLIKKEILKDKLFNDFSDEEILECIEKIENFLFKKLYKKVFPITNLDKDSLFFNKCRRVYWITPELLGINKKYLNEYLWAIASNHLKNMDEEKCPFDKLKCVQRAFIILNNCIIFCSGKKEGAGVDDIVPILIYIIVKIKPKRIYSNFNYIKALIHPSKLLANYGFLLTQMEMCIEYIEQINHTSFKMSEVEFTNKCFETN